jgi:hypothetical protein
VKNYIHLSFPIIVIAFLGSCGIAVFSLAVIVANSFVPGLELPFSYYQALRLTIASILLPLLGIAALTPVAFYHAFSRETPAGASAEGTSSLSRMEKPVEKTLAKAA